MKFGSLFSGIGGFDLGFERAGMKCAWQCEIDQKASAVLARHWPGIPNIGDVRNVRRDTVAPIDVLCGGFPCQDLSVAGKRAGLAGERSGLWFEFARVIDELEPGWVVIENVPGLLSSNRGRDFAIIVQWLVQRGYGVVWRILDAQYFGLAQRRKRVFIVASFGSGRCAEILFEREGRAGDTPPKREAGEGTAAYAIRRSQTSSNGWGIDDTLAHTLDGTGGDAVAGTLAASGAGLNRPAGQGNELDFVIPAVAPTIEAEYYKKRYSNQQFFSQNGDGEPVTPIGVRRLTPTECERLQGFPDDWADGQADSSRYKQLGNAVAVPVVEWIGKRIVEAS